MEGEELHKGRQGVQVHGLLRALLGASHQHPGLRRHNLVLILPHPPRCNISSSSSLLRPSRASHLALNHSKAHSSSKCLGKAVSNRLAVLYLLGHLTATPSLFRSKDRSPVSVMLSLLTLLQHHLNNNTTPRITVLVFPVTSNLHPLLLTHLTYLPLVVVILPSCLPPSLELSHTKTP